MLILQILTLKCLTLRSLGAPLNSVGAEYRGLHGLAVRVFQSEMVISLCVVPGVECHDLNLDCAPLSSCVRTLGIQRVALFWKLMECLGDGV